MVINQLYKTALWSLAAFMCPKAEASCGLRDSLAQKDFSYLFKKIESTRSEASLQRVYLSAFLNNAKTGGDYEMLITAYKNYADYADGDLKIAYADSMVNVATRSRDTKLIGSAYLSRGIAYYGLKRHKEAMENYLLANNYISKINDSYLTHKLRYNIAHEKYYLNQSDEAIALFNSCLAYFRQSNERAYLNTLHSLGLCYNKIGDYGKSAEMVLEGKREAGRLENHSMDAYFQHLEGLNNYFQKNYASAITILKGIIPLIDAENDYANVAVANFYIGKSYWAMKRYRESLSYFRMVDSAFLKRGYIRPDLRENYELLIQYYKRQNDPEQVLIYVDRILKADSILQHTHDFLYDEIHKNFDTKELVSEKARIELQLANELQIKNILQISGIMLLGSLPFMIYAVRRRKGKSVYKSLFGFLENDGIKEPETGKNIEKELDIPADTAEKIFAALEKWEQGNKFLEKGLTLTRVAVTLGTNTRYVSGIISFYKGKKFPEYLNDLKVDYIVKELRDDRLKRNYINDALADEAGFSSTQRFVSAFKSRMGVSPSQFSEDLKRPVTGQPS